MSKNGKIRGKTGVFRGLNETETRKDEFRRRKKIKCVKLNAGLGKMQVSGVVGRLLQEK
jgi:hypothetical protein